MTDLRDLVAPPLVVVVNGRPWRVRPLTVEQALHLVPQLLAAFEGAAHVEGLQAADTMHLPPEQRSALAAETRAAAQRDLGAVLDGLAVLAPDVRGLVCACAQAVEVEEDGSQVWRAVRVVMTEAEEADDAVWVDRLGWMAQLQIALAAAGVLTSGLALVRRLLRPIARAAGASGTTGAAMGAGAESGAGPARG